MTTSPASRAREPQPYGRSTAGLRLKVSYVHEFGALGRALAASRRKFLVFMAFVMLVVPIMGSLMYVVEGPPTGTRAFRSACTGRSLR